MTDYMGMGETWENDPQAYVEALEGNRREFMRALAKTNMVKMMESWDDKTLGDVVLFGSDLALHKKQNSRLIAAAKKVLSARYPALSGLVNGMAADGTQK